MRHLFEYGDWSTVNRAADLKKLLNGIWNQESVAFDVAEESDTDIETNYQPFIQFDGEKIRAKNFVGFIQNDDELIEIYPKVFRKDKCENKALMLRHIFFWFRYCRKWRFPFAQASLDQDDIDQFPELIIHLIANQIFHIISTQPLMQYENVEEVLTIPRGRINFSRYLNNSIVKGNFHKIECDYAPFLLDNKVNRIIKYCIRILMSYTRFRENIYLLQESLNVLDEVEDIACSIADINSVSPNSFYGEYLSVMESCKLIINHQLYSNNSYELSQWCLLFPMEYIFEDFVAGFFEKHFSAKWEVHYQRSDGWLSNKPKVFNMQHDIYLVNKANPDRKIIIDTKYKIRDDNFKSDSKKGIQQSDLYQMLSYAYERGCTEVFLIYPNIGESLNVPDDFEINSGFENMEKVRVTAMEIPFWSVTNFTALERRLKNCLEVYF